MDEPDVDNSNAWYTEKKKKADTIMFSNIAVQSLDIEESRLLIRNIVRLGGKRNDGRPRPLKITFESIDIKREILGKARLLRSTKHRHIYINPDLTPQQRKIDAELREELKKRRDGGEKFIQISKGKIIQNLPPKKLIEEIVEDIPPLESEQSSDSSESSSEHSDAENSEYYSDITENETILVNYSSKTVENIVEDVVDEAPAVEPENTTANNEPNVNEQTNQMKRNESNKSETEKAAVNETEIEVNDPIVDLAQPIKDVVNEAPAVEPENTTANNELSVNEETNQMKRNESNKNPKKPQSSQPTRSLRSKKSEENTQ